MRRDYAKNRDDKYSWSLYVCTFKCILSKTKCNMHVTSGFWSAVTILAKELVSKRDNNTVLLYPQQIIDCHVKKLSVCHVMIDPK